MILVTSVSEAFLYLSSCWVKIRCVRHKANPIVFHLFTDCRICNFSNLDLMRRQISQDAHAPSNTFDILKRMEDGVDDENPSPPKTPRLQESEDFPGLVTSWHLFQTFVSIFFLLLLQITPIHLISYRQRLMMNLLPPLVCTNLYHDVRDFVCYIFVNVLFPFPENDLSIIFTSPLPSFSTGYVTA